MDALVQQAVAPARAVAQRDQAACGDEVLARTVAGLGRGAVAVVVELAAPEAVDLGHEAPGTVDRFTGRRTKAPERSEEHTSELQSPCNLVCRLLLEKKNKRIVSRAWLPRPYNLYFPCFIQPPAPQHLSGFVTCMPLITLHCRFHTSIQRTFVFVAGS